MYVQSLEWLDPAREGRREVRSRSVGGRSPCERETHPVLLVLLLLAQIALLGRQVDAERRPSFEQPLEPALVLVPQVFPLLTALPAADNVASLDCAGQSARPGSAGRR
jgi:hypothetical protein